MLALEQTDRPKSERLGTEQSFVRISAFSTILDVRFSAFCCTVNVRKPNFSCFGTPWHCPDFGRLSPIRILDKLKVPSVQNPNTLS